MSTVSASSTISGRRAGFSTQEEEVQSAALPVEGELPPWLRGTLLRTGPAKWEVGDRTLRHWFDGYAKLHKFSFQDGQVNYASRFLRGRSFRTVEREGRMSYPEFASDPCRSLFARVTSLFTDRFTDNCNINVTRLGERFISMTETPMPLSFDRETLETAGVDHTAPGHHPTAHPHADRDSGELVNHVAHLGPRSEYRFFAVGAQAEPRLIGSHRAKQPAYVHSFGMSENYLILAEVPLVINPLKLAMSAVLMKSFRWKPERGTRFIVIDRRDGSLRGTWEVPPFFAFHHINAFEEGSQLCVDIVAYPDAKIIDALHLEGLRGDELAVPVAEARRYRLSLESSDVSSEVLYADGLELTRINYRHNARPYRYVYGASIRGDGSGANGQVRNDWFNRLVKLDVAGGDPAIWEQEGCYPGEPVFVAAPDGEKEDSGAILSITLDARDGTSFLLVLDGESFEERARAAVPQRIPFHFHGNYFS